MEMFLNILCVLVPLLYLITYVAKQNKRRKRNYLYGLVVTIVLFLILFVIRLFVLTIIPTSGTVDNKTNTTTTKQTTTETTTTTTEVVTEPAVKYDRLSVPDGGTVLGKTSKGYEVKKVNGLYYIDGYLVANKTYNLPESYNPGSLNKTVNEAAKKMFNDAKTEKGFNLYVGSGFRSYESQSRIYNNYVNRDGKAAADTYSARAGYSEHQTGYAMDICDSSLSSDKCITSKFDNTEQAKWLAANAHKYGFILRYVNNKDSQTGYMYESWHFRYVGTDLSYKLYNNGDWLTMEEYFGFTSSYDDKPVGE